MPAGSSRLTVAVTGPTGDIGRPFVRALGRSPAVGTIRGMARRPFDPAQHGWRKVDYRQGDVLDRDAVRDFVRGADVVVHLAFIIMGNEDEAARVNLEGSRNVFEEAVAAGAKRLVYASSVAAYGFHDDNPQPLTEDVGPRADDDLYYARHKAELERLLHDVVDGTGTDGYLFRPSGVAGPTALLIVETVPEVIRRLPFVALPLPGGPIQLVHEEDVATALRAAVLGKGKPGAYNLAGEGTVTVPDIARALGWKPLPFPDRLVRLTGALVKRLSFLPSAAQWITAARVPVLMDTSKARRELGWRPKYDARETLRQLAEAARARGLVRT